MASSSGAYSPGVGSSGSTGSSCSGGCFNENGIKYQYLQGYFGAHMLPASSYRYVYLLWFITIFVCLVLGVFHMLGVGERSYIGALWKRWATKNRVYKIGKRVDIYGNHVTKNADGSRRTFAPPKQRRIFTFPSFGRLVLLFFMLAVPAVLTLVGADFIGPNVGVFDFSQSWPPQTSNLVGLSRRALQTLHKRVQWGQGSYPSVTTVPPTRTLPYRTWWTQGDRTGDITMALVPIVLIMAMKQVPFALLSTRFFGGYAFDRLSFLHKWGGRIIWLFGTAHLVTWCVQLNKDTRIGDPVWSFVFMWTKFRWGWASYGFLTAMTILSIGPIRNRFYEWFYIAHVITVAGFIVTAMLHHPPLAQWMYIPLAWWVADRLSRALKVAWVNGLGFAGRKPQFAVAPKPTQSVGRQAPSLHQRWQHSSEKGSLSSFVPIAQGQYARDPAHGGHGAFSSFSSSHKYPPHNGSVMSDEYEATLVDPSHDVGGRKVSTPQSSLGGHGTLGGNDHPLAPDNDREADMLKTGTIERRGTNLSAMYDPVSELLQEYIPAATRPLADIYPPPAPVQQDPRLRASIPARYALEDPADASESTLRFNASPKQRPNQIYPPTRHVKDPSYVPPMNGRPSTMFSTMSSSASGLFPRAPRPRPAMSADVAAVIRPGYAFVQLLPGKTLRLTLRTPNKMSWKPGQWVYLNIPAVRFWESHPFTIASAHDADFPVSTEFVDMDEEKGVASAQVQKAKGEERTMVLLVRCRKGFTRQLWNHVAKKRQHQIEAAADAHAQHGPGMIGVPGASMVSMLGKDTTGVHIRAIVDGPYGSAQRTSWGIHSTVVIVCGGSGVSFGMSVLEHLCACIVGAARLGKGGKGGKNFLTQRIRFVWIMREFSHLQWIASALRRCVEMVPPEQLQVDLFVTHINHRSALPRSGSFGPNSMFMDEGFAAPSAPFASTDQNAWMSTMEQGQASVTPRAARFTEGPEQDEYDLTAFDLTYFDGEDQSAPTAAEEEMNKRIQSEGKLRRANTRRATVKRKGRQQGKPANTDVSREEQTLESQRAMYEGRAPILSPSSGPRPLDEVSHNYSRPNAGYEAERAEQDLGLAGSQAGYHDSSEAWRQQQPQPQSLEPRGMQPRLRAYSNVTRLSPPSTAGLPGTVPGGGPAGLAGFVSPDNSRPVTPRAMTGSSNEGLLTAPHPYAVSRSGSSSPAAGYGSASGITTPYGDEAMDGKDADFGNASGLPSSGHTSTLNLLNTAVAPAQSPRSPLEDAPIDLDADEDVDLRVVAELAKPGHPKLDRIIRQEVERSQGRTLVAGCGPKSLDIVLRSIVSKQIDPTKVRKGDSRGIVNVVSECFEWGG